MDALAEAGSHMTPWHATMNRQAWRATRTPPGPDGPLRAYAPCVRGGCVNGHSHLLGGSRMAWLRLLKVVRTHTSVMLREPVGNSFNHSIEVWRLRVLPPFIGPPCAAWRLPTVASAAQNFALRSVRTHVCIKPGSGNTGLSVLYYVLYVLSSK